MQVGGCQSTFEAWCWRYHVKQHSPLIPSVLGFSMYEGACLFLTIDALFAAGQHDFAQLLGHHVVSDLGGVHGQQLVLLLLALGPDLLKAVLVLSTHHPLVSDNQLRNEDQ